MRIQRKLLTVPSATIGRYTCTAVDILPKILATPMKDFSLELSRKRIYFYRPLERAFPVEPTTYLRNYRAPVNDINKRAQMCTKENSVAGRRVRYKQIRSKLKNSRYPLKGGGDRRFNLAPQGVPHIARGLCHELRQSECSPWTRSLKR